MNETSSQLTRAQILLEQYKLIEARRNYTGNLIWSIPGFFIAVFAVLGTNTLEKAPQYLPFGFLIAGITFWLNAWIAHRSRVTQDQCETLLRNIEDELEKEGFSALAKLPRSSAFGARFLLITFLLLSGIVLCASALWMWLR